jgi:hypothetical protein
VRSRLALALLVASALAGAALPAEAQCAMCKAVLTGSEEGRNMGAELNRAIILMLAAPYVVFATGAAIFFRKRWSPVLARYAARLRG